ncbi:hypothetical protein I350_06460 [Cryptococcus amylolentus CBS 6273]|uniref:C-22 sterol desaturase n=1 Tax=Cryptococcus amylolentus CBS 6273 TaxID=1296118 RepID=A0A1E3JLV7_9TREE|nr:hypothetical protein I350_06460 [Cryptococcus amylolentus CBS 6273]
MASHAILNPTAIPDFDSIKTWGFEGLTKANFSFTFDTKTTTATLLTLLLSLLVLEQVVYRSKKAHLPGNKWTIPLIGAFADSLNPTLANYKAQWDSGALSAVSVFNIFIVIGSSNEMARKIMNSPNHAEPCLVASAKKVLLPENWVFGHGKGHADYRKALNVLFTKQALSTYLPIQEKIYRSYFTKWMTDPQPAFPYMMPMRDLNMDTSLSVFCGPYISEEEKVDINKKYWLITLALELVNFPFAIPGTKVYNAIQARKTVMKVLTRSSAESKIKMADFANEPECLLDEWTRAMINAQKAQDDGETTKLLQREYSDHEIAMVLLSFLFASQDAMSSAIVYSFQLTADHPEVLAKIREEQYRIRGNDLERGLTLDMIDDMVYTRAVVKEVLRIRPPVIMVPYLTTKPFPVSPEYTVPKNSMIIPAFWNSLHDDAVYTNPDAFAPERWLPNSDGSSPLAESKPQNYMVWGSGPHKCIGVQYASMHLAATLGTASVLMDWEHEKTELSDDVQVIAAIFPKDHCKLKFTPRAPPA